MAQPLPDARLSDTLANEGGVPGLRAWTLLTELGERPVGLQPRGSGLLCDHRPIAAPGSLACRRDHRRAHGIENHISRQFQQVGIPFDQDGFEPPLEDVAHQPMAANARLGVDAVELPHALGEVGIRRLDDEVIMAGHLAIGVAAPVETDAYLAEQGDPIRAVLIVVVDRLATITARGDVILKKSSKLVAVGN
jgi:hypothetical protein